MGEKKKEKMSVVQPALFNDTIGGKIAKGQAIMNGVSRVGQLLKSKETDPYLILLDVIAKLEAVPYCQFPISFSTIDIVPYYMEDGDLYVLLGRKHGQPMFQVFGGFRDPGETSEEAAARELEEESSLIVDPANVIYVGTKFINDGRYKDSPHKITTSMFMVEVTPGAVAKALELEGDDRKFDDIAEIKAFHINLINEDTEVYVRDLHVDLAKHITNNILMHTL